MPLILIDIFYGLLMASAGAISVLLLQKYAGQRCNPAASDDSTCAREVLASLHELSSRVSVDIGEHSNRVQEFNDEVQSGNNPEVDSMVTAVAKIVHANQQMQTRLAAAEEKLQEQSRIIELQAAEVRTDGLTQLINRRGLDSEMARRFSEFKRFGTPFCVMFIDIDDFKVFNNQYGHAAGDEVLRGVAAILRQTMREIDLVARYGGEEFVVVMPHILLAEVQTPTERVREAIERATFRFEETDLSVTASIGIAQLRSSEHSSALLQRADAAMYAAKQAGRNRTYWHDGKLAHPIDLIEKSAGPHEAAVQQQSEEPQLDENHPVVDATCDPVASQGKSVEQPPAGQESQTDDSEQRVLDSVLQSDETDSAFASELQQNIELRVGDRSEFCQAVRQRLAEWKRGGSILSLILLEIEVSSQIDKQPVLAERIRNTMTRLVVSVVRDMDVVAKYYPDCLGIMFPGAEHGVAIDIARRLHQAIDECDLLRKSAEAGFTVSLGLVEATEGDDLVRLLRRAEEALHCSLESDNNSSYYHNGQWPEPVGVSVGVNS